MRGSNITKEILSPLRDDILIKDHTNAWLKMFVFIALSEGNSKVITIPYDNATLEQTPSL